MTEQYWFYYVLECGIPASNFWFPQYVRVVYLTFSALLGILSIYFGGLKETMGIELTYTILGTMTVVQQLYILHYHKGVEEVVEVT